MKKRSNWKNSIFREMGITLVLSLILAAAFFIVVDSLALTIADRAEMHSKESEALHEELQSYVTEKKLSSEDMDEIGAWAEIHAVLPFIIEAGDETIYDGFLQENDISSRDETELIGGDYELKLSDCTAKVTIYAEHSVTMAYVLSVFILMLSFFLFLTVFLSAVRKKIEYIEQLNQEIEILGSGNLDYPITVKGSDELSQLAEGVESLRTSFLEQIEETDELAEENQTMVSRISHDLRTPLTAISLYADILENNDRLTPEQQKEYVGKITKKVQHMIDLSEHLLRYSREQRVESVVAEKRPTNQFFYEELSDFCSYLLEQGFTLDTDLNWDDTVVYVNEEAVERVLNNMSSNLLKYADRYLPVKIRCWYEEEFFFIEFRNSIAKEERYATGSGIGLYSVEEMMVKMQGASIITATEDEFIITLQFKIVKE